MSDRIGRKRFLIVFGVLATLGTVPLPGSLRTMTDSNSTFVLVVTSLVVLSLYTSISGLVKAERFPPEVRVLGVSLPYAIANALFGGTVESVEMLFKPASNRCSTGTSPEFVLLLSSPPSRCATQRNSAISATDRTELTFVRSSWGNRAPVVDVSQVTKVRKHCESASRSRSP